MWTREFWLAVTERGVKSFAQGAAASWALLQFTTLESVASQGEVVLVSGIGVGVLSVLTSIASGSIGPNGPSLGPEKLVAPRGEHEAA